MSEAEKKMGISSDGREMHYSAGVVISCGDKYLLLERMFPPPGFASPAGHVDKGEESKVSALREVLEETGIKIEDAEFLFEEEVPWNYCRSAGVHHWYVYKAQVSSMEINRQEEETKSAGWYTTEEMKNLPLEEVWKYFYEKLGII